MFVAKGLTLGSYKLFSSWFTHFLRRCFASGLSSIKKRNGKRKTLLPMSSECYHNPRLDTELACRPELMIFLVTKKKYVLLSLLLSFCVLQDGCPFADATVGSTQSPDRTTVFGILQKISGEISQQIVDLANSKNYFWMFLWKICRFLKSTVRLGFSFALNLEQCFSQYFFHFNSNFQIILKLALIVTLSYFQVYINKK